MDQKFRVGDEVAKLDGDYKFQGWVVAAFQKRSGVWRYVVENTDGILHIFNDRVLIRVPQKTSEFS